MARKKIGLLHSGIIKEFSFVLGILFLFLSFFIAIDPKPFLRFGLIGVFIFSLLGSGTPIFPFLVGHLDLISLALTISLGMALNDSISWVVGRSGDVILPRSRKTERLEHTIQKYGSLALFLWALIPFPYDLIGLIAGYLRFPYPKFILFTFLGRFLRFILLGVGILAIF